MDQLIGDRPVLDEVALFHAGLARRRAADHRGAWTDQEHHEVQRDQRVGDVGGPAHRILVVNRDHHAQSLPTFPPLKALFRAGSNSTGAAGRDSRPRTSAHTARAGRVTEPASGNPPSTLEM